MTRMDSKWRGPDYIPVSERADYAANYAMEDLERMMEACDRGHEHCFWMIEHLYEMHKLRDERLFREVNDLIVGLPVEVLGNILAAHCMMYGVM